MGTHFSRLLRPAWAAVELFFFPVTTRGVVDISHPFTSPDLEPDDSFS